MCECGCVYVEPECKVKLANGKTLFIGVYASCSNCYAPAGIDLRELSDEEIESYDLDRVPEPTLHEGNGFIPVIHYKTVRKKMYDVILGLNEEVDDVLAEILCEEAFPDLRDVIGVEE